MAVSTNSEHAHVDPSRRSFLKGAGALAVAGSLTGWPTSATASTARRRTRRRTFRSGTWSSTVRRTGRSTTTTATRRGSGAYGMPPGYSQPDGHGGTVKPYHLTNRARTTSTTHGSRDPREWNNGAMDGFYTTDGIDAMGVLHRGTSFPSTTACSKTRRCA